MSITTINVHIRSKVPLYSNMLLLIFCIISLFYYISYIYQGIIGSSTLEKYLVTNPQRIICGFLLGMIVLMLYRLFKFKAIYPILFAAGSIYIFSFPYFTVVDETYHYAYVDYIANNYRIPLVHELVPNRVFAVAQHVFPSPSATDSSQLGTSGVIYEAFQPPLYYFIAAIVYKLSFGKLAFSVYLIKYLGLFLLLSTVFIVKKIYEFAIEKRFIRANDFVLFAVILLFSLTPGYMLRMLTISNVNLLPALGALHLYFILKYSFEESIQYRYHIIIMALLTSGMVLTQITAVYLIPLTMLFVFWKKDIRHAIYFSLTVGAIIAPWFVFNYIYYGESTASNIVMEMQKIGVNPNNDTYGLWYVATNIPRMASFFWNPQEGGFPDQPLYMMMEFITVLILIAIVSALFSHIKKVISKKESSIFLVFCSTAIIANILIVFYITISQSWDILIGRYLYMSTGELAILLFVYINNMRKDSKYVISVFLVFFSLMMYSNYLGNIVSNKIIH